MDDGWCKDDDVDEDRIVLWVEEEVLIFLFDGDDNDDSVRLVLDIVLVGNDLRFLVDVDFIIISDDTYL